MKQTIEFNYPKYPAYKDSGVECLPAGQVGLGEIPEHWEVKRLKNTFRFSKGLSIIKENLQDEGIPCVNYGEIHSKYGFEVNPTIHHLKCVSENYIKNNSKSLVKNGEFIFADTSEDLEGSGNFTYLNYNGEVFAGYHTIIGRPSKTINTRFLAYILDSTTFRNQVRTRMKGVKVYSITQSILKDLYGWHPPLPEQTAITTFLDDKTRKIDAAIAQKKKMIELLKERKQIIIQDLVTGKKVWNENENAWTKPSKVKDSGVECLPAGQVGIGEIPEDWEVIANKLLFEERKEPGRDNLPLLSVSIHTAVSSEELSDEDNIRGLIRIEDKTNYKYVDTNDIVFNMMRAWQGAIGAVSIEGMVSPAYVVAKPNTMIVSRYFEFLYRTDLFIQQMSRNSKGITDFRKRLYWDEFKQLKTILPPKKEQNLIVRNIENISLKIDRAISLQQRQIEKLKEYKATLIDSAVTGKIRVKMPSEK